MAQTVIRAPESTENIPAARRVRDVADRIAYLDPDIAPLTLVLSKARSKSAYNTKFEWIEKDLAARWTTVIEAIADANPGATATWDVAAGTADYFSVGDIANIPETGEKVRITAVDTGADTIDVVRGVGTEVAGDNLAATNPTDIQIIGNAYTEGSASGDEKSHQETYPYNYTQIIRTPFGVSGSEAVSENYTGPDRTRLRAEKAKEHKIDMERTAIFGERNIDTASTNNPRRYTGGFLYFTEANGAAVKDAGGVLTEPEMEDWLEDVFAHTASGDTRLLLSSPLVVSVIDQLAVARLQMVPSDKTYGIAVRQWVTSHGTLNIVKHRLLENGSAGFGYAGYALAIDPGKLMYRFLRDRNTKLRMDIQDNDLDGYKDEYLTEVGWQVENPAVHGILSGVTG